MAWFSRSVAGIHTFLCEEMAPLQGCFAGLVPLARVALSTCTDVVGPNGLRPALYLEKFEGFEGYAERILQGIPRMNDRHAAEFHPPART